jgi:hypothetical protein
VFGLRIAETRAATADPKFDTVREEARTMTVEEMVALGLEDILRGQPEGEPLRASENPTLS